MLFDAHVHLSDEIFIPYIQSILLSLKELNINACSVTVDFDTSNHSLSLFKNRRDIVTQFIGIHPQCAVNKHFNELEKFKNLFFNNIGDIDGIGEIGLDPTYNKTDNDIIKQKKIFCSLLDIAEKYKKPISLHSRKSVDEIINILTTYKVKKTLFHWFAGNKKQLKKMMDMGFFVSYGPASVYSKDRDIFVKTTNIQQILVETDGPVFYSRCFSNFPSSPISCLPSVINHISEIINISYFDLVNVLKENSEQFLGKKFPEIKN